MLVNLGPKFATQPACIAWAEIAIQQRQVALDCMSTRQEAWAQSKSEDKKAASLAKEFQATMQAVIAAATCIDAFYDHLVPFAPISESTREAWNRKKTARYIRIAETLRVAFRIKPDEMKQCIEHLKPIYLLRDFSVHPSSAPAPPYPHPDLDIRTDWRLTVYRGDIADVLVTNALRLLWDATRGTKCRSEKLTTFMDNFRTRVEELLPDGEPKARFSSVAFTIPEKVLRKGRSNGS